MVGKDIIVKYVKAHFQLIIGVKRKSYGFNMLMEYLLEN
jgi:hypothetical protein